MRNSTWAELGPTQLNLVSTENLFHDFKSRSQSKFKSSEDALEDVIQSMICCKGRRLVKFLDYGYSEGFKHRLFFQHPLVTLVILFQIKNGRSQTMIPLVIMMGLMPLLKSEIPLLQTMNLRVQPYIDPYFGGVERTQLGQTASLGCRVYSLYNR